MQKSIYSNVLNSFLMDKHKKVVGMYFIASNHSITNINNNFLIPLFFLSTIYLPGIERTNQIMKRQI